MKENNSKTENNSKPENTIVPIILTSKPTKALAMEIEEELKKEIDNYTSNIPNP